jgi:D-alanyl-D-alanine carboxypeptidase/D-alanyl-D-alanine-endopeptidase (penicillin-binding protein 4)
VQQPRVARGLGLAAQVADVDLERVGRRAEVVAPDAVEDHLARQHLTGVVHEQLEQQELGARQLDPPRAAVDLVGARVELEVREAQDLAVLLPPGAAQQGAQPREQLLERERLGQVVVGAGLEPGDAVGHPVARRQHQHRRAVARVAHPPAHLEPVELRHEHVEQHRVGPDDGEPPDRLAPVGRHVDLEPVVPQRPLERLAHRGLVFHHEDPHGGGSSPPKLNGG